MVGESTEPLDKLVQRQGVRLLLFLSQVGLDVALIIVERTKDLEDHIVGAERVPVELGVGLEASVDIRDQNVAHIVKVQGIEQVLLAHVVNLGDVKCGHSLVEVKQVKVITVSRLGLEPFEGSSVSIVESITDLLNFEGVSLDCLGVFGSLISVS